MCFLIKTLHATFVANIKAIPNRLICSFLLRYMIVIGICDSDLLFIPEIFKIMFKYGFLLQNYLLNLCCNKVC